MFVNGYGVTLQNVLYIYRVFLVFVMLLFKKECFVLILSPFKLKSRQCSLGLPSLKMERKAITVAQCVERSVFLSTRAAKKSCKGDNFTDARK